MFSFVIYIYLQSFVVLLLFIPDTASFIILNNIYMSNMTSLRQFKLLCVFMGWNEKLIHIVIVEYILVFFSFQV